MKYPVGTVLECNGVIGYVIEDVELSGDICVVWETELEIFTYDAEWLDESARIIEE